MSLTGPDDDDDEQLMFSIHGGWDKGNGVFISRVERETKAAELGVRKGHQILAYYAE